MSYKQIPGYSNYSINKSGKVINTKYNRELKNSVNSQGYQEVQLWQSGKGKTCSIHRLVAITFIPNPESKPQVNHIDGNRVNNEIENLEWVTNLENIRHSKKRNGGKRISKKKIMKMYKSKQWESVEDFLIELMKH